MPGDLDRTDPPNEPNSRETGTRCSCSRHPPLTVPPCARRPWGVVLLAPPCRLSSAPNDRARATVGEPEGNRNRVGPYAAAMLPELVGVGMALLLLALQLHWLLAGQRPPVWTGILIAALVAIVGLPLWLLTLSSTRLRHRFRLAGARTAQAAQLQARLQAWLAEFGATMETASGIPSQVTASWAPACEPAVELAVRSLQAPGSPHSATRATGIA